MIVIVIDIVIVVVIVIIIICNGSMYITSRIVLSWVEWTSITIVIIGMTLYELVLHYHIISYHMISHVFLLYLICWFDLHCILFYSILFYFISNRFDLIPFYSIQLNLIYCIVQYSISYQWMICVCLSVRASVHLSVYLSVWISLCFLFSPVSLIFLYSFFTLSFLIFISLSLLFSYERLPHTDTHTDTDTHIHMNICSFLWLVHITSKGGKWSIVFEWLYYIIFDLIR